MQFLAVGLSVLLASFLFPPLPTLSDAPDQQGGSGYVLAQELEDEDSAADLAGDAVAAADSIEIQLFDLANRDSAAHGLSPLRLDYQLLDIARVRAAAQSGLPSLSHLDASGQLAFVRLITNSDVNYRLVGENLARVSNPAQTAAERAEEALMNSPAHRANILEPTFDSLIVGRAVDPAGQIVFAQIFRAGS